MCRKGVWRGKVWREGGREEGRCGWKGGVAEWLFGGRERYGGREGDKCGGMVGCGGRWEWWRYRGEWREGDECWEGGREVWREGGMNGGR